MCVCLYVGMCVRGKKKQGCHEPAGKKIRKTNRKNLGIERIQINQRVDAGVVKGRHAAVVVGVRVDVVDAYHVRAQLLHERRVALALLRILERVILMGIINISVPTSLIPMGSSLPCYDSNAMMMVKQCT